MVRPFKAKTDHNNFVLIAVYLERRGRTTDKLCKRKKNEKKGKTVLEVCLTCIRNESLQACWTVTSRSS
jgi:hypothetical protein